MGQLLSDHRSIESARIFPGIGIYERAGGGIGLEAHPIGEIGGCLNDEITARDAGAGDKKRSGRNITGSELERLGPQPEELFRAAVDINQIGTGRTGHVDVGPAHVCR